MAGRRTTGTKRKAKQAKAPASRKPKAPARRKPKALASRKPKALASRKPKAPASRKPKKKALAKSARAAPTRAKGRTGAARRPAAKAGPKRQAAPVTRKTTAKRAPPKTLKKTSPKVTSPKRTSPDKAVTMRSRETAPVEIPEPAPSERVLAACAQLPAERDVTDEERDAMEKVAATAQRTIGADGGPAAIVSRIAAFVDEVRSGAQPEPESQDVRLGLGVLWGEQLRAEVGWRWVHLTYPDGFESYAIVPDDRAFACFPLNRIPDAMKPDARTHTSVGVFESICAGALPTRKVNAYLVIG